jgi:hypothetical protein
MKEKLMQDLIIKFASVILDEPELTYLRREVVTGNNRLDIVLLDRRGRHVLVEVQSGSLDTKHIDRHIDYSEGYLENHPMVDIRILYVANHIDIHRKNFLQRRGHEYKEISEAKYQEVALAHGYSLDTTLELPEKPMKKIVAKNELPSNFSIEPPNKDLETLIQKLKSSERYQRFQTMLPEKIDNEAKAQKIIQQNVDFFKADQLKKLFDLVESVYPLFPGPWFGRLITCNQKRIIAEGDEKVGRWMAELIRNDISDQDKIDALRKGSLHLTNASVGIITIILYLRNKSSNSIWFEPLHDGLTILYPQLGKFNRKGEQYVQYNTIAKKFAQQYSFDDSELDWIFQEIHKLQ